MGLHLLVTFMDHVPWDTRVAMSLLGSYCLSLASSQFSAIFSSTTAHNAAHSGLTLGSRTRSRRDIEAINRKEIVQTSLAISVGPSDWKSTAWPALLSLK